MERGALKMYFSIRSMRLTASLADSSRFRCLVGAVVAGALFPGSLSTAQEAEPNPDPDTAAEKESVSEETETETLPSSNITILAVVGAEGAEEYGEKFRKAADMWREGAEKGGARFESIGLAEGETNDREKLETLLGELLGEKAEDEAGPLWIVLIGHGTFDGRTAKFNVRGPDFTDAELAEWLKKASRPLAVINTTSSSAPFLKTLAGEDRIVITATKSAFEVFYARFGEYFAQAISGLEEADLDNDEQVSLLEAFLYSADQVSRFYEMEGRLATEHALIDDTGDGFGTRPDWFEGVRATRVAKEGATPDGERAHQFVLVPNAIERRLTPSQRQERDALERQVKELVRKRPEIGDDAFYDRVEPLLLQIARLYETVGKEPGSEEEAPKPGDDAPVSGDDVQPAS